MAPREQHTLSDFEPGRPSPAGAIAICVVAVLLTVIALAVVVQWGPIGEWEAGNTATSLILDAFALWIDAWVISRALATWRRYRRPE
jgi:hypothetical protein